MSIMVGRNVASPTFDKLRQGAARPGPPILADASSDGLLPAVVLKMPAGAPKSPAAESGLRVGVVLYLVSVGLVATAAIGVFFGIGLYLLVHPTEAMLAGLGVRDSGAAVYPLRSGVVPRAEADAVPIRPAPETPGSGTAALPVLLVEPGRTAFDAPLPPNRDAAKNPVATPPVDEVTANPAVAAPADATAPALSSVANDATIAASAADTTPTPEPAPRPRAAPSSEAAPGPGISGAEIAELLSRGDALLRLGDVASARLFYERAAAAGDAQAAMRMGATFDPAFFGRAGGRGDPAEARAWYRRAADLSAAEAARHPTDTKTK